MKDKSFPKSTPLNDYHKKRNEEALKAVSEMAKQPYSLAEAKAQAAMLRGEKPDKQSNGIADQ